MRISDWSSDVCSSDLTGGRRQQVWAESLPAAMLERSAAAIAERSALAIRYALGVPIPGAESPPHYPLAPVQDDYLQGMMRSEEHTSELQSLMRISYAVFCL